MKRILKGSVSATVFAVIIFGIARYAYAGEGCSVYVTDLDSGHLYLQFVATPSAPHIQYNEMHMSSSVPAVDGAGQSGIGTLGPQYYSDTGVYTTQWFRLDASNEYGDSCSQCRVFIPNSTSAGTC